MQTIASPAAFRAAALASPGPRVLVPTMGALHEGHLALIRRARTLAGPAGTVMVSIFVNPVQFDRPADLASYPQPLAADLAACAVEGADLVFTPDPATMYFPDRSVTVTESELAKNLCGATRPGHFDGVCTVVLKLAMITAAETMVFGEKDYQQLAVIRRMARDLDLPVEIAAHPTVRESDGLAMSSRNTRLQPDHRADAPRLRQALLAAQSLLTYGEHAAAPLLGAARQHLEASPFAKIDYLELVDAETLQPIATIKRPAVLATAVFYGDVRLIDNITLLP